MARQKDWRKVLSRKIAKASVKTEQIHKEVTVKRAKNKSQRKKAEAETPKDERPDFGKMDLAEAARSKKRKAGQTGTSVVNWFNVQGWFKEGMLRNNPDWLVVRHDDDDRYDQTWWCWREKSCAEKLLKHYGPKVVEKTVAWFCDNWQGLMDASDYRLTGAPTINLLWVSRERYFVDAKLGKKPKAPKKHKRNPSGKKLHMVGEYNAESASKSPDFGWGDV